MSRIDRQLVGEGGSKNQYSVRQSGFAEADAFCRTGYGKVSNTFFPKHLRDRNCPVPVRIGFHDGHEVRAVRSILKDTDVVPEGGQVDRRRNRHEFVFVGN